MAWRPLKQQRLHHRLALAWNARRRCSWLVLTIPSGCLTLTRQAIQTDSLVFLSGCIPLVPETMKVIEGGIEEQTVSLRLCVECDCPAGHR